MGSPALFILIFAVASVNDPAVLIRGMPDLGAKPSAAVSAFNLIGEDADPAVPGRRPGALRREPAAGPPVERAGGHGAAVRRWLHRQRPGYGEDHGPAGGRRLL